MGISRIAIHETVAADHPPEKLRGELERDGLEIDLVTDADGPDVLSEYDAIITLDPREDFLESDVEWVHVNSAGVDDFPLEEYTDRGIVLTNSTGIHGMPIGEHVVAEMIMFGHKFDRFVAGQHRHEWIEPSWDDQFCIDGESVCVLGVGGLGSGIIERAHDLGMEVTAVRRSDEPAPFVEEVYTSDELLDAIADVTFVVIALPLTDDTHHLIDRDALDTMRDDAYLINVGRGPIVDEDALVEALRGGDIAGAGLDVFEEEPLPPDSPFWDMENVVVTPHRAGNFRGHYQAIADLVNENLERIESGEELVNRVA